MSAMSENDKSLKGENMTFELSKLKRDKTKAREGVTVECGGGLEIVVVSTNESAGYKEMMVKDSKAIRRSAGRGQIDTVGLQKLQTKAVAKHILKGWNLTEKVDGVEQPIQFNEFNVLRAFDESPEFFEIVVEEASNYENFRLLDEADLGNSETS